MSRDLLKSNIISMFKVLITAILETSDHDGYCSGNECDYESRQIVHLCDVPTDYQDCTIGKLHEEDFSEDNWSEYWIQYLPEQKLNTHESYYCDLCEECESAGLERHAYVYTIISVEIVDVI